MLAHRTTMMLVTLGLGVAALCLPILHVTPAYAERAVPVTAPAIDVTDAKGLQTAVLAGGCFWGVEAVFEQMKGVKGVISGYAGGTAVTARYELVSAERTKHAEVVRISYDPAQVSYGTLLRVFFSVVHDPTQLNRQGPDTGPSYRSAIFPQTPAQEEVARAYIAQLGKSGAFRRPIVTTIEQGKFFPAEPHHQDFARKNPNHAYIVRWDKPKVAAFTAAYANLAR